MLEWIIIAFPVVGAAVVFTLALVTDPHDLVLQRITAPSALEERGYPAETLADLLENKITGIVNRATSFQHRKGIELSTADTAIDQFADIVKVAQPIRATQRLLGFVNYIADVYFIERSDNSYSVHLRIRDANSLNTLKLVKLDGSPGQTDELLNRVATGIVAFVEPYIMAAYLYNTARANQSDAVDFGETVAYLKEWLPFIAVTDRPWFYNLLGRIAAQADDRATAIGYYQEALRWQPRFALAHANWGRTLYRANRYADAAQHYRLALAMQPDLAIAHVYLAEALLARRQFGAAVAHLDQARALAPELAQTYEVKAAIYEHVGLPEPADRERQRARLARIRQPRQSVYDAM